MSMRLYKRKHIDQVRHITQKYGNTHGEPIAWGWKAIEALGINDIDKPEWGAPPLKVNRRLLGEEQECVNNDQDEEIPVFWGCGVTPQEAVMRADLRGTVMAHAPGHMLILDLTDRDIVSQARKDL